MNDDDNIGGGDHGKDDPGYAVLRGETSILLLTTDQEFIFQNFTLWWSWNFCYMYYLLHDDDDAGGGDHSTDDPGYAVLRGETTIVLLKTDTLPSV